jgi:hypothetical protein
MHMPVSVTSKYPAESAAGESSMKCPAPVRHVRIEEQHLAFVQPLQRTGGISASA